MPSIRAPATKKTTTLTVAVKCRPLTERERGRDIVRVNNNKDVYERSISSTIAGVIQGLNATVFAYGSTGSGKTYSMVGTQDDPGLMVLSLHTIFDLIKKDNSSDIFEVSCSYLEVYNEVIYDLLEKSAGHLELREDPEQGIVVAGLRCIKVKSADKILELLNSGNSRRKTESTGANETSSRSHAVLEITVTRKQRNKYSNQIIRGKLALVDLAGSERASETNSGGQKLRDGANINRSLLALANCINALRKQQKKGLAYVPYRNSKLTRILKDGLSGNSQTVMIATISPANSQYHHTVNTLKYADRAKEIKTHIQKNIGTIDIHMSDYQRMIDSLQIEVCRLKKELAEKESRLSAKPTEKTVDAELSWLNILSQETSENVQERINLQKALFELEETNLRNRSELQHLDDAIAKQQAIEKDGAVVQALGARRQVVLDNIRDNDELGVNYQKEIEANEKRRCQLQDMIEEAISNNGNKTYLRILSQYRLLKNIGTIDIHMSDYQRMIDSLQIEVCRLKKELAEKESRLSAKPTEKTVDAELSWLNILSQETSENVQERINLQKALFELEETNLRNRSELQHLDDAIAKQQAIEKDGAVVQALGARRQVVLDNIRDNDELGVNYQKEIEANEKRRCQLQDMIEEAISNNGNKTYLRILSQYRLLGMANTELQFEMAMRDQIIYNQREAQRNLWNLLMSLGLDEKQVLELAAKQGIAIEDWTRTPYQGLSDRRHSQNVDCQSITPLSYGPYIGQSYARSSWIFQQNQDFGARSFSLGNWKLPLTFCREEHHNSYYYRSQDHSSSAYLRLRSSEQWVSGRPSSQFGTPDQYPHKLRNSCPQMRTQFPPYGEGCMSTLSFSADFGQQQKEAWTNAMRQPLHEGSLVGTSGSQDSCKGIIMCHGRSTPGLFEYSSLDQGSSLLSSNQVFRNPIPPNHSDVPWLLASYSTSRPTSFSSCGIKSHPS
ncbi:unnamed protein product [Ilex paraguariensis]|uniref:Kinesin-like protein n=1 Tax=Ilex paraguariensis TaxID=185542 RepID=A0ABC8S2W1_9AQUA